MMRSTRSGPLLVAFSLLNWAATAYAECAWVLWEERPTHSNQWTLSWTRGAFETKKECDQAARVGSEVEAKALGEAQKRRLTPKPSASYTCLPDTVDPRGEGGPAMTWRAPDFDLASGLFVPQLVLGSVSRASS